MIRRKKILLNVFFSLLCSYSRSKGEEKVLKTKFAFLFSILISSVKCPNEKTVSLFFVSQQDAHTHTQFLPHIM